MKVLIGTCGVWYFNHSALAFHKRDALAALWVTEKNLPPLPAEKFRRCWPFHLAMKPFYSWAPQIWTERMFYRCFPVWKAWLRAQTPPEFNAVYAMMGFATEMFDLADRVGALKVVDCPNTHPTTYFGFWQRECDLWCPGEKVPIPRKMFARMNRELERADLIVVPSTFSRESMVLNGLPAEKVLVNPFGVDTGIFTPRARPPVKPRFICVGTICLRKGHPYLFRAFERVKKMLPDAELICIGGRKTDFRREWPKWEGTFTHYPSLPHPRIAELLQTSTAFVMPSQEEGIPRALMEALACGVPAVGTHAGGASTVVQDGVEGFIVPPHDIEAIARAMVRLGSDTELNQKMGEAAHRKGASRNTWQDYGDRLLAAFEDRLSGRAK